jgi:hypothetical protein
VFLAMLPPDSSPAALVFRIDKEGHLRKLEIEAVTVGEESTVQCINLMKVQVNK